MCLWTLSEGKGKASCEVRQVHCVAPLVSLKYRVLYKIILNSASGMYRIAHSSCQLKCHKSEASE